MRVSNFLICALLQASAVISSTIPDPKGSIALESKGNINSKGDTGSKGSKDKGDKGDKAPILSGRPNHAIGPRNTGKAFPVSPARNPKKICQLEPIGGGKDDSNNILAAFHKCNNGGTIVFPKDRVFTIGTALDLRFLNKVDIKIQGTIRFPANTDYWQKHSFKQTFQNATTFWQIGGEDVNVYGDGTLDGQGQPWWELFAKEPSTLRPILLGIIDLNGGRVENLKLLNSPQWYILVKNSHSIVFSDLNIDTEVKTATVNKNSDGIDMLSSSNIVFQNSIVNNNDDCVSFKPNTTDVVVQNLQCTGSHGISIGSLGQYLGQTDTIANIQVFNITMKHATGAARIKVWPGSLASKSKDLQGGGGDGSVKNVVFDTMIVDEVEYAIEVNQCYGLKDYSLCVKEPTPVTISDVTFKNFRGTTNAKRDPYIGRILCAPGRCKNIKVESIAVKSPGGFNLFKCGAVSGLSQISCKPPGIKI